MTQRERLLAVYRGETPDVVPYLLDLSHWFYQRHGIAWDLSVPHTAVEDDLLACHRQVGAGFYIANLAPFWECRYRDEVESTVQRDDAGPTPTITWSLHTPLGSLHRTRVWEERSYAWGIREWGVKSEQDLRILRYAMEGRRYTPRWDTWQAWQEAVGDLGTVYMPVGYSGLGQLLHYWMGIEQTCYAIADAPDLLRSVIDTVNDGLLDLVDLLCQSPAEVIFMTDNFSSETQPPAFFNRWSKPFYDEAIRRFHAAGKYVSVHIDGRLRHSLAMIRDCGADCADAVTPNIPGDLSPAECRAEAGPDFILSGGVSPGLWLPSSSDDAFRHAVLNWLDLRHQSSRLIAAAGDQVPPGAAEHRLTMMRDLVEEHGRYH